MTFENEGRFVAICILFSLVILLVILATVLSWRVTWPRTAAFMVALLWFFVALLMLLGMGLMNGIYYVSSDTCLYGESFAVQYAYNQVEDPVKREWVVRALLFYLVPDANATATDDPISQVFNIDLKAIDNVLTVSFCLMYSIPLVCKNLDVFILPRILTICMCLCRVS